MFHLRNVNRAKTGDKIEVINGKGALYFGEIREIRKDEAVVVVAGQENKPQPPLKTVIAPSLIKKKPMNLLVEKLTEIGVAEIRPVIYTRTDEKYSRSMLKKWLRIAAQSLKVNKKLWLTAVYPPVSMSEIIAFAKDINTKILLDKDGEEIAGRNFTAPVIFLIGPPGDYVPGEKELLRENGFTPYKINDCVLRSETAAISIAAIAKMNEQQS